MNDKTTELAWKLIDRCADLMRSEATHTEGELEMITASQQNVLGVVYTSAGDGIMVKDIATETNVTRGAASQIVESLVKLDMLERIHSEEDRRAVFVRTTAKGKAIRKKFIKKISPIFKEAFSDVNESEGAKFLHALEKLAHRLIEMKNEKRTSKSAILRRVAMEKVTVGPNKLEYEPKIQK